MRKLLLSVCQRVPAGGPASLQAPGACAARRPCELHACMHAWCACLHGHASLGMHACHVMARGADVRAGRCAAQSAEASPNPNKHLPTTCGRGGPWPGSSCRGRGAVRSAARPASLLLPRTWRDGKRAEGTRLYTLHTALMFPCQHCLPAAAFIMTGCVLLEPSPAHCHSRAPWMLTPPHVVARMRKGSVT